MDHDGVVLLLEAILTDIPRLDGGPACRGRHEVMGALLIETERGNRSLASIARQRLGQRKRVGVLSLVSGLYGAHGAGL
ncbi:MAG: hypothetical protein ACRDRX_00625 [Pseudonocardiaceae bacterium]